MSLAQAERIRVDLVWRRLISILEDEAQMLIRTAFSTTTRESGDLSVGVFDLRGRMVAQAVTGTPGHVNSMAMAVKHFLAKFPAESLGEGDVLTSNDPWICSGHLHDFTTVMPIVHDGAVVGLIANTIHVVDIGGLGLGPDGREVFEEGLCVPICKLADRGRMNEPLIELIKVNVREPEQVTGDLFSAITGNQFAALRVTELMAEFQLTNLESVSDAIIDRTRSAVEQRIAELPDGVYFNTATLDGYDEDIELKLRLEIAGSRIILDFSGSSPVSRRGVNVVLNYTSAYAVFGVNCALNQGVPCNAGSLEPVEVIATPGSILNAQRPASVSARHIVGHVLPDLVFGALAQVMTLPAEGAGLIWMPSLRGRNADGSPFATVIFNAGGAGAHADRDGWNVTAFPSGVKTMPVEAIEATVPVLIRRKELRIDSGGAGEFRGGLGQTIEIEGEVGSSLFINAMFDRMRHAARGREGGRDGATGGAWLRSGEEFFAKGTQELKQGDRLVLELPGGAGVGDPTKRAPSALQADISAGYVSAGAAREIYGANDARR